MKFWLSLLEKFAIGLGSAAGVTLVVYLVTPIVSSRSGPSPHISWVRMPIPHGDTSDLLDRARGPLESAFPKELADFVNQIRANSEFTIFEITITNETEQAFKPLSIIADSQLFGIISRKHPGGRDERFVRGSEAVQVPALNPQESVRVSLVTGESFWFATLPVRILQDGKLVRLNADTIVSRDDPLGIISLMMRYPIIQFFLVVYGAFALYGWMRGAFFVIALKYPKLLRNPLRRRT